MNGDGSPANKSLVLVAGSGRSGTSLFSGVLQRLGFHVPKPEVAPDLSNPRGFAESQWVVDFHTELLERAGVHMADARPDAWARTAAVTADETVARRLREFLDEHYARVGHLLIKDPRLSWFLPLWQRCADDLGVSPAVVTMLRHPAAVIDSKGRYYGSWQGDVGRAAGWLNTMLFTERSTREMPRMFVRYEDLLEDWTEVIARVGEHLDLIVIRDAGAPALRKVHQFIDPTLRRSSSSWDQIRMPLALRQQAEHVWTLLSRLADKDSSDDMDELAGALDLSMQSFVELYQDAEAIAQSSVLGMKRQVTAKYAPRDEAIVTRWIPRRLRRAVPWHWRRRLLRMLGHSGPGGRSDQRGLRRGVAGLDGVGRTENPAAERPEAPDHRHADAHDVAPEVSGKG